MLLFVEILINSASLFNELIADKLIKSRIVLLLREKPRATGEISEALGLSPSDVARHMNSSSRQGFVRYDTNRKCYALAWGGKAQAADKKK